MCVCVCVCVCCGEGEGVGSCGHDSHSYRSPPPPVFAYVELFFLRLYPYPFYILKHCFCIISGRCFKTDIYVGLSRWNSLSITRKSASSLSAFCQSFQISRAIAHAHSVLLDYQWRYYFIMVRYSVMHCHEYSCSLVAITCVAKCCETESVAANIIRRRFNCSGCGPLRINAKQCCVSSPTNWLYSASNELWQSGLKCAVTSLDYVSHLFSAGTRQGSCHTSHLTEQE